MPLLSIEKVVKNDILFSNRFYFGGIIRNGGSQESSRRKGVIALPHFRVLLLTRSFGQTDRLLSDHESIFAKPFC